MFVSEKIYGYALLRKLGTGGMAEVWYAENKLGKRAAVKILSKKLSDDENIKVRFEREARVMVKLNHPNIRQVYDYGMIEERPCIIMEYLDGEDLGTLIKKGGEFSQEQIIRWWNQMSSALNYTHGQGVVHRDIKPSNIFITNEGNVELLDFGIAKVADNYLSTMSGMSMGTPMYMSPEQVISSKHIDYRSDVYSLAVTFVHLLGGKAPYSSDMSVYNLHKSIVEEPLDLSGIPLEWRYFLSPYLAKQPEARPKLKEYCIADTDDTKISEPKIVSKKEEISEPKTKAEPKTTDETLKDVGTKIDNNASGQERNKVYRSLEPDHKKPGKKVSNYKGSESRISKVRLIYIFAGMLLVLVAVPWLSDQLGKKEATERELASLKQERDSLKRFKFHADSLQMIEVLKKDATIKATGIRNGYEYVDLGLSVKWATRNIGAEGPWDCGNYYAWGETLTKSTYSEENNITYNKPIDDIAGNIQYDAARKNWGGNWRLPTSAEWKELIDKCKLISTCLGFRVVGNNGRSIFIPYTEIGVYRSFADYWSSTPHIWLLREHTCAWRMSMENGGIEPRLSISDRYHGHPIRPVIE